MSSIRGLRIEGIAASGIAALTLTMGCAADEERNLVNENKLTVGVSLGYKPMSFSPAENSEVGGTDYDLIAAVADELDLTVKFEQMGLDDINDAVESGEVDAAISELTDSAKRQKVVGVIDNYRAGDGLIEPVVNAAD